MQDKGRHTQKNTDLEQRLSAYYGPRLREQPLTRDSWQQLRHELKPPVRRHVRLRLSVKRVFNRYRAGTVAQPVPEYVRTALNRIAYDAHVSCTSAHVRCTFKKRLRGPAVHVSPFRKRPLIKLLLPVDAERSLGHSGLDILLASGLARYQLAKNALLIYLLLAGFIGLGATAAIFSELHQRPIIALLIVIIGGLALAVILDRRRRQICYVADELAVLWVGRGRMCEGLHVLAQYTRAPQRRRWGEPSLHERIARVCGTRVENMHERLTMVR